MPLCVSCIAYKNGKRADGAFEECLREVRHNLGASVSLRTCANMRCGEEIRVPMAMTKDDVPPALWLALGARWNSEIQTTCANMNLRSEDCTP
jgi:hypothetical protein